VKTTPKPRATKNSRGDCVVVLPLLLELAAVDDAASDEFVVDAESGAVSVLVIVCVLSKPRATTFTISTMIWLMTVILTNVMSMDGKAGESIQESVSFKVTIFGILCVSPEKEMSATGS
jgi:hypothetical protein